MLGFPSDTSDLASDIPFPSNASLPIDLFRVRLSMTTRGITKK